MAMQARPLMQSMLALRFAEAILVLYVFSSGCGYALQSPAKAKLCAHWPNAAGGETKERLLELAPATCMQPPAFAMLADYTDSGAFNADTLFNA
jgi:hypothetical protein